MAIKQKTIKPTPRTAIKALLYLDEHKAEIVFHDNKCYLLSGDKALYLTDKIFDNLLAAGWITSPQAIDNEHSNSLITAAGREKAQAIRKAISKYTQLPMFEAADGKQPIGEFTARLGSVPSVRLL